MDPKRLGLPIDEGSMALTHFMADFGVLGIVTPLSRLGVPAAGCDATGGLRAKLKLDEQFVP